MLKSITTTNFKKLSSHSFEFTDGLNIICGDNFKGKTTLTQAIAFALFGVRVIPGAADKIPTWGEKNCEVILDIGQYKILRTLKNCAVNKNGEPVATGIETCNDYIEKNITGVDYKGFQILNWSAQGETSALLTMGAAQLQRDVEKFSGVSFIDEMLKLASVDLRDASRETKLFETRGSQEDIEVKIVKSEKGVAQFLETRLEMEGLIESEDAQKIRVEDLLASAESTNRKHATNQIIISTLTSQIKSGREDVTRMEERKAELEAGRKETEALTREGYELRKEGLKLVEKTNLMVGDSIAKLDEIGVTLDGIDDKIEADKLLEKEIKAAQEHNQFCNTLAAVATSNYRSEAKVVEDLDKVLESGVCHACGQNIATESQISSHKKSLKKAELGLSKLKLIMDKKEIKADKARERLASAVLHHTEKYRGWADDKAEAEERLTEMTAYLKDNKFDESLDARLAELEKSLEALAVMESEQKTLKTLKSQLNASEESISLWEVELKDIQDSTPAPIPQDAIDDTKLQLKEGAERRLEAVDNLHQADKNTVLFNAELKELKLDLEAELQFRDQMIEVKSLTDFTAFLKDSRVSFLSTIWSSILSVASDFLIHTTDGNITSVTKSDKEGFLFCEDGVYAPIESASGAQRAFIGVGVRLALAKCLRSACELVVLDEPTESMREENALRLAGGLLGRGQVIMVTHRESDKLSASNIIEL